MNNSVKKALSFEQRHKIISLLAVISITILLTRLITSIEDLNLIIKGFELHHFYYGLLILIIASLLTLFQRGHFKLHLIITGIALGLIIDELVFIGSKVRGPLEYPSTFPSTIIITIVICLIAEAIIYFSKKSRR